MNAFLLGLSNGAVCLAYCAPVLVPCLLGGDRGAGGGGILLLRFLAGRLAGYLLFGMLAWAVGRQLVTATGFRELIVGCAYLLLGVLLLRFGIRGTASHCAASRLTAPATRDVSSSRELMPEFLGLATGLNFCPPFLLAFTEAANEGTMLRSLAFFMAFFLGTALFFIPLPFIGLFGKFPVLRVIGRMSAGLLGIYYGYSGIIMITGVVVAP